MEMNCSAQKQLASIVPDLAGTIYAVALFNLPKTLQKEKLTRHLYIPVHSVGSTTGRLPVALRHHNQSVDRGLVWYTNICILTKNN